MADQQTIKAAQSIVGELEKYRNERGVGERWRRQLDIATVGLLVVTAAVTIATYFVFGDQLNEMRNDRRAWIGVQTQGGVITEKDKSSGNRGAFITLFMRNSGKTPAKKFEVKVRLLKMGSNQNSNLKTA